MAKPLPHPTDVVDALDWLREGAPAVRRRSAPKAEKALRTLLALLDALPAHLPVYCYGSPEWRAAMGIPEDATQKGGE